MKLLLNARPYPDPTAFETWGNWLEALDADSPRTGCVVTAVRFDGVDEPVFCAADILGRRLDAFDTIEVDTAPPRVLVARTLTEAATMACSLAGAAGSVGDAFRQTDLGDAHAMLPQLVDGIRTIVTLTDACASVLGVRRETITCQGVAFDDWMAEFGRRLAGLLEAQTQRDWVTVADSLQYEIEPALRGWVPVFEAPGDDRCQPCLNRARTAGMRNRVDFSRASPA